MSLSDDELAGMQADAEALLLDQLMVIYRHSRRADGQGHSADLWLALNNGNPYNCSIWRPASGQIGPVGGEMASPTQWYGQCSVVAPLQSGDKILIDGSYLLIQNVAGHQSIPTLLAFTCVEPDPKEVTP